MPNAILRLPAVKARTGLSRSSIYRLEALGDFPKRVGLGMRAVGWLSEDIDSFIESRVHKGRGRVACSPELQRSHDEANRLRRLGAIGRS